MDDNKATVLIIDDEKDTLTLFGLLLTSYGYKVLSAEDGRAGLELVAKEKPDIVVTDLKMPGMDGLEVLKRIKKQAPRTEVVVVTGYGDMDLVVQALNLEATDFINKPIKRSALEAALRRAEKRLQMPEHGAVTWQVQQGFAYINIEGTLRRDHRDELMAGCREAKATDVAGVVFKFNESSAVNGAGITELISCLSRIRDNQQPVAIVGLSENFKAIFEMVGVTRLARLFDSETDALAALQKQ